MDELPWGHQQIGNNRAYCLSTEQKYKYRSNEYILSGAFCCKASKRG